METNDFSKMENWIACICFYVFNTSREIIEDLIEKEDYISDHLHCKMLRNKGSDKDLGVGFIGPLILMVDSADCS